MMHAYAYANANAMQLRTKHLKCYNRYPVRPRGPKARRKRRRLVLGLPPFFDFFPFFARMIGWYLR
jgi:hypothetical protein